MVMDGGVFCLDGCMADAVFLFKHLIDSQNDVHWFG